MCRPRLLAAAVVLATAACSPAVEAEDSTGASATTVAVSATPPTDAATAESATASSAPSTTSPTPELTRPDWLGQRVLTTDESGFADAQETPVELVDRRLPTVDTLPPPADAVFIGRVAPFEGEPLERSTWEEGCPVAPEDLRYLTLTFWGFDDRAHTGELVVHADAAEAMVGVFEQLYDARFPIEEMRIVTPADLDAEPTGDGNNTTSFVCRAVTGGSSFSEHAYGLAIDVNPFHNPYERGELVLPELATAFLDRAREVPGMIEPGSVAVQAFAELGWSWGGDWQSLKDYQHFSHNGR